MEYLEDFYKHIFFVAGVILEIYLLMLLGDVDLDWSIRSSNLFN